VSARGREAPHGVRQRARRVRQGEGAELRDPTRPHLRLLDPCDEVSTGDFSGVDDAVFYRNGGIAYSCNGNLRLTDSKGDREVEPQGAKVAHLAVSANARNFLPQLFYVADTTPKTIAL